MPVITKEFFPELHTRLLLVEGKDDFAFFLSLAKELEVSEDFWIYNFEGRDNLRAALNNVVQDQRFEELKHLRLFQIKR
jgi:hypothetical protein